MKPLSCGNPFFGSAPRLVTPEKPLPIAGETWYEIRPPSFLRFRTGKGVENAVVFPAFTVLAFVLFPGAWELAVDLVGRVFADPAVTTAEP